METLQSTVQTCCIAVLRKIPYFACESMQLLENNSIQVDITISECVLSPRILEICWPWKNSEICVFQEAFESPGEKKSLLKIKRWLPNRNQKFSWPIRQPTRQTKMADQDGSLPLLSPPISHKGWGHLKGSPLDQSNMRSVADAEAPWPISIGEGLSPKNMD